MLIRLGALGTLFAAGCGNEAANDNHPSVVEESSSTTATGGTTTTAISGTTATEPEEMKDGYSEAASVALNAFRQSMVGTSELFAVAYFGYADTPVDTPTNRPVTVCPNLCADLPFLAEIPAERVVGSGMGEVFCLVPLHDEVTVEIYGGVEQGDAYTYDTLLYRSEIGAPLLLYSNASGFDPDTQVVITDGDNSITWYPRLANTVLVERVNGTCDETKAKDFTPYAELLRSEYVSRTQDGWVLPTAEQLIGTTWNCTETKQNGDTHWFEVTFCEGVVDVCWNNDGEDHEYIGAAWSLTSEQGVARITFDFGNLTGIETCAVLLSQEADMLYTFADMVAGETLLCESDVAYRVLRLNVG